MDLRLNRRENFKSRNPKTAQKHGPLDGYSREAETGHFIA